MEARWRKKKYTNFLGCLSRATLPADIAFGMPSVVREQCSRARALAIKAERNYRNGDESESEVMATSDRKTATRKQEKAEKLIAFEFSYFIGIHFTELLCIHSRLSAHREMPTVEQINVLTIGWAESRLLVVGDWRKRSQLTLSRNVRSTSSA